MLIGRVSVTIMYYCDCNGKLGRWELSDLEVGVGELVARELGDLGVVHLDIVDADELLDDAPRPLVESVQSHGNVMRLQRRYKYVVPKGG